MNPNEFLVTIVSPSRSPQQEFKLWDSFQDPPDDESSVSGAEIKWIGTLTQILKIVTYWIVFIIVGVSSVLSKLSFLMMTSHVADDSRTPYCDITSESTKSMFALIDC